jgi:hypothetical protein
MNEEKNKTWFPVKRYGIGWGLPTCWQGWVVMVAWLLLIIGGTVALSPDRQPVAYAVYNLFVTALLVLVVAAKGEKPLRWRWGDDSDQRRGGI